MRDLAAHQPGCLGPVEWRQVSLQPSVLCWWGVVVIIGRQGDKVDAWEVDWVVAGVARLAQIWCLVESACVCIGRWGIHTLHTLIRPKSRALTVRSWQPKQWRQQHLYKFSELTLHCMRCRWRCLMLAHTHLQMEAMLKICRKADKSENADNFPTLEKSAGSSMTFCMQHHPPRQRRPYSITLWYKDRLFSEKSHDFLGLQRMEQRQRGCSTCSRSPWDEQLGKSHQNWRARKG